MDLSFEIHDDGLYYQNKLVGTFIEPVKHRDAVEELETLVSCANHSLTKYFMVAETSASCLEVERAKIVVWEWAKHLTVFLGKRGNHYFPQIPLDYRGDFERACAVELWRLFALDEIDYIKSFNVYSHNDITEMFTSYAEDEFLEIKAGSLSDEEDFSRSFDDILDVAERRYKSYVNGDYLRFHFDNGEHLIKITDRDLAIRLFDGDMSEWAKLLRKCSAAGHRVKRAYWLIVSSSDDDEEVGEQEDGLGGYRR